MFHFYLVVPARVTAIRQLTCTQACLLLFAISTFLFFYHLLWSNIFSVFHLGLNISSAFLGLGQVTSCPSGRIVAATWLKSPALPVAVDTLAQLS
ncbi:hypothetical protein BDW67DRAFT_95387 [Aspergillus spinulosporus]